MELHAVLCQACKHELCSIESSGYELTNCKHGFCKPCLGAMVADGLVADHRSAHDEYSIVTCPIEGCRRELSRQDLRFAVGPGVLDLLDEHVMHLLTKNVICPLLARCTKCEETLLFPAHKVNSQVLRSALRCNGLNSTHSTPGWLLQHTLLCSKCFLMLCNKCGAHLTSLTEAAHKCDPLQKRCFDFASSIMKLCSAYVQETQTNKRKLKARKSWLFSFFRSIKYCGLNKRRLSSMNTESRLSWTDSELMLKSIIKGFHEDGFEERVQSTDSETFRTEDGNQAACVSFLRKKSRMTYNAQMDEQAQAALQELTNSILDMVERNQGDLSPSIVALMCSHSLPYKLLKWLLRNNSVIHATEHSALYRDVLSFLRALSSSWDLLPLLCNPQLKYDCWVAELRWETPGSVMSDFENLFRQAQFMLRRNENFGDIELERPGITTLVADIKATYELLCNRIKVWEEKTSQHEWSVNTTKIFGSQMAFALGRKKARSIADEEQQLLHDKIMSLICKDNLSIVARLSSSNATGTHSNKDGHDCKNDAAPSGAPPGLPSAVLVEAYKKTLRPLQFDEGCLLPSHYFRKDVESRKTFALNKRRARVISNEMMELNMALPLEWESSIFLRMDEQHTDVLRALIIGPEGTPYENGIFLFDLLLGEEYPDTPPKVQFLTTNAGKVRFNPNLYANGTVCLSILGTWTGPGWKAGESSIMQVLVSLQALVLVADPYYNEPFTHIMGLRSFADTYISDQRYNTVVHSLLPALRSPDPLFKPVIHAHFRLKAPYILRQCKAWIEEETRADIKENLTSQLKNLCHGLQTLTGGSLE